MRQIRKATERGATLGGHVLSLLINRVYGRGGKRPLHPRGETRAAVWSADGAASGAFSGVPILDGPGDLEAVVRHSRAVGLAAGRPDIEGIAVRLAGPGGGELLLASTGSGRLTRHLLLLRRSAGVCSTMLPMRTASGPVLIRLLPVAAGDGWEISWSRPGGRWHRSGLLTLGDQIAEAEPFDPIDAPPRGLEQYPSVARLRRPSYDQAARQRSATGHRS